MYLLLKLVRENPFMRPVVAKEVQQLLVRGELVAFYFSLFRKFAALALQAQHAKSKRKGPKKPAVGEDPTATRLKLLSAILTGINRALPYGEGGRA